MIDAVGELAFFFHWAPRDLMAFKVSELQMWLAQLARWAPRGSHE